MTPSTTSHPRFRSNPFATRWTQPGACPFLFPGEMTIHQLAIQLRQQQGWGQIVGPHGSGKSTLLATLVPELERPPSHIACYRLHQGQRQLPVSFQDPDLQRCNQVIVDGFRTVVALVALPTQTILSQDQQGAPGHHPSIPWDYPTW